jgi:hypothetical protein
VVQVCGGPALSLFRHEELELLVCGLHHYDFDVMFQFTSMLVESLSYTMLIRLPNLFAVNMLS